MKLDEAREEAYSLNEKCKGFLFPYTFAERENKHGNYIIVCQDSAERVKAVFMSRYEAITFVRGIECIYPTR